MFILLLILSLEAIAVRLEAVALGVEAITIRGVLSQTCKFCSNCCAVASQVSPKSPVVRPRPWRTSSVRNEFTDKTGVE